MPRRLRLVMMGTGTFAEPTFDAILASPHPVVGLVTQPDRPIGHERGSTRQTGRGLKTMALERGVPVLQPPSVNTPEAVAEVRAWEPDLLVVAAYGQILSQAVLDGATLGGINVHASLLPRYRGAAPVAWAIYHGDTRTGVTIIRMSSGLDAGDMLAQKTVDISPEETAGELEARLAVVGAGLVPGVIERLADGAAFGEKQEISQVTRAPRLRKEHGAIDWTRHARDVACQVRAMQPWPTPYTYLCRVGQDPVRVIIGRAAWAQGESSIPDKPGQAWKAPGSRLLAGAGQGTWVEIHEIQPAGKRRMTAAEFLRGHPLGSGDTFGSQAP